jgi:hypothetical protein
LGGRGAFKTHFTGKGGGIASSNGKTRITIYLDNHILDYVRAQSETRGVSYQTLINEVLKQHSLYSPDQSLTETDLNRILREELSQIGQQ